MVNLKSSKTILITGGAGFIGSNLADRLMQEGYRVVVIDNLSTGKKENLNSKVNFYKADIGDAKISNIFEKEKPEIVYHFAAQINVRKSTEDPIEDARINILGSINILENCRNFGIEKIIFASTGGAIYGEADVVPTSEKYPTFPLSPYGIAKLATEKYLHYFYKTFGLPFIALRLANVYGPRQNSKGEAGVVAIFCDKMLLNKNPIIYGSGKQTRDFVYVQDVVESAILAMKKNKIGIFNIGTGKETNINTVFEIIKEKIKSNCKKTHEPARQGEQQRSCLDYLKAKKEILWRPKYNLQEGLELTVQWFKDNIKSNDNS